MTHCVVRMEAKKIISAIVSKRVWQYLFFVLRPYTIQDKEFKKAYDIYYKMLEQQSDFALCKSFRYDAGVHPKNIKEFEYEFVARRLSRLPSATNILDIGSHRQFILGLLSYRKITTLDVRKRMPSVENETVITCDARQIDLPDNTFDVVTSVSSVEHFGLGRYGDEFDLDADKKALKEMIRVLKPGGYLIFTTVITGTKPFIAFNAHRVYSLEMIKQMVGDMQCIEEKIVSCDTKEICSISEVTKIPWAYDVYCGIYQKK